jgi:phage major head subunit gpT-like protein
MADVIALFPWKLFLRLEEIDRLRDQGDRFCLTDGEALVAKVNRQQRAQHVDVRLNARLGWWQMPKQMRTRRTADGY